MGPGPEQGVVKIADFGLARIFQGPLRPLADGGVSDVWWRRRANRRTGSLLSGSSTNSPSQPAAAAAL